MSTENYTATYSPEDNKLRLYSLGKLPADLYARVKAAGFKYAPRQDLFVAPMWTPSREDLLLELCGEVDDEDTSLVDRAEQRAERFEDYSDKRGQEAERARQGVAAIADNIPFGQPILVGHHSERHARRDAAKIENGMRRAIRMWETSAYWTERAKGAIRHAKYKELPAVRARRIKTLEAEKRKVERNKAQSTLCLKFWAGELKKKSGGTFDPLDIKAAIWFTNAYDHIYRPFPLAEYPRQEGASDYEGDMSLWGALGGSDRVPIITPAQARDIAVPIHERSAANSDRWIAHYENRIAYERAMLGEAGGIVTDRVKPEKGGACQCWASPGYGKGWSYIQKVNKVSVTLLDKYEYSQRPFTRTISFDKLRRIMTARDVEEARADGRLQEIDECGFLLLEQAPEPLPREPKPADPAAEQFEAMKETLKAGVQVVTAPQLFPTPKETAEYMAALLDVQGDDEILEPSAGTGMLIGALGAEWYPAGRLVAVEINGKLVDVLRREFPLTDVRQGDFLECNGDLGTFDRIIMNPPFVNGADIKHIQHARTLLKPGGKLVALCANGPRQREALQPIADYWEDLPEGTFSEQGSNVNVALLVIHG